LVTKLQEVRERNMKVLIVHDAEGYVKSLGIPGPESGGQVYLVPGEEEIVSEVEIQERARIAVDSIERDGDAAYLVDLVENHRVEVGEGVPRLVPIDRGSMGPQAN
jgi:hypothetical protein